MTCPPTLGAISRRRLKDTASRPGKGEQGGQKLTCRTGLTALTYIPDIRPETEVEIRLRDCWKKLEEGV